MCMWVISMDEEGSYIFISLLSNYLRNRKERQVIFQYGNLPCLLALGLGLWRPEEWNGVLLDWLMDRICTVCQYRLEVAITLSLTKFFHSTDRVGQVNANWFTSTQLNMHMTNIIQYRALVL